MFQFVQLYSSPLGIRHKMGGQEKTRPGKPGNCHMNICINKWPAGLTFTWWVFLMTIPFRGYLHFLPCDLHLEVWFHFENFYLSNINDCYSFDISHEYSLYVTKSFRGHQHILPLTLTYFIENFKFAANFWKLIARVLILDMSISCDKTFRWGSTFCTLWPWLWSLLAYNLKTLHC